MKTEHCKHFLFALMLLTVIYIAAYMFWINYYTPSIFTVLKHLTILPTMTMYEKPRESLLSLQVAPHNRIFSTGWWSSYSHWSLKKMCYDGVCYPTLKAQCSRTGNQIFQYIPIKTKALLRGINISMEVVGKKKSSASRMTLLVGIRFSNGTLKLLRRSSVLDFVLEPSPIRLLYISPPEVTIWGIILMLECRGKVSDAGFKNVVVFPISGLQTASSLSRSDVVDTCFQEPERALDIRPCYLNVEPILVPPETLANESSVTLATQLTMSRLKLLNQTMVPWEGAVSIAVFLPAFGKKDEARVLSERNMVSKFIEHHNLEKRGQVTIVVGNCTSENYPINTLRNIAIREVKTEFLLLLDVDFQPSADLQSNALRTIRSWPTVDKTAFVVPGFEFRGKLKENSFLPRTKSELVRSIFQKNHKIQPVKYRRGRGHTLTNYRKWYKEEKSYILGSFDDMYEPYVLLKNTPSLPLYDERFRGYGMDKITYIMELCAAGYQFVVLPDVWITHLPHPRNPLLGKLMSDAEFKLRNRMQRFEFLHSLIARYNISRC
ncbi:LARGE xylosyl- and glucuronyltransferase 2-B-like isoform X1 [Limulus polyphemus]|uniref:LARGE xylosyl- and glucuronyltransferase 2-B-like isoform X1 n=2 Tax=Limulus polyphemus TaxID=6850 RepID=A0ABM1SAQ7_LIMPO|nr:LARGE xylosyl- and glucuronyltransferase 2-B-like isoform X1 [Limulus polyphemus]